MAVATGMVVLAFALFLLGLAILIFLDQPKAERFLRLFASTAQAHYTEQLLRLLVGLALVIFSPSMWFSAVFLAFGLVIAVSAVALLIMPWRWHHCFGQWAIPFAIRHIRWYAAGALALSACILYGLSRVIS